MASFTKVASTSDIPAGTGKTVEVGGKSIAVFNCDGTFYAVDNTCKHQGGPLGEGSLSGTSVTCPWHGWQYDVSNGQCKTNPSVSLRCYDVKVENGEVLVSS